MKKGLGQAEVTWVSLETVSRLFEISIKSSTTGFSSGIPSLLLIASAARSGSPGMSGPLVPGVGLVFQKTHPLVDLFFEFVFVDEAVNFHGAEDLACFDSALRRAYDSVERRVI